MYQRVIHKSLLAGVSRTIFMNGPGPMALCLVYMYTYDGSTEVHRIFMSTSCLANQLQNVPDTFMLFHYGIVSVHIPRWYDLVVLTLSLSNPCEQL